MDGTHSIDIFWGVVWFIVTLLSLYHFIKCYRVNGWELPVTTIFLILLGSFIKVLNTCLSFYNTNSRNIIIILSILKNFPTFTLLASFLLVVLFWISTYHDPEVVKKNNGFGSKLVIPIYFIIILIHFTLLILVGVTEGYKSNRMLYQATRFFTRMYSIIMSVSFSAAFLIYGFLVGRQHNNSFQFYSCALVLGLSFLANGINIFLVSFIIPIINDRQIMIVTSVDNLIDCFISLEIIYLVYIDTKAKLARKAKLLERSNSNISDDNQSVISISRALNKDNYQSPYTTRSIDNIM